MKFIGRKTELKILENAFASDRYEGILVYGRRRVGKTEMIKEAIKNTDAISIYYESKRVTDALNAEGLCEVMAEAFDIPVPSFPTVEKAVEYIFEKAGERKIILIIDEYPYLREKIPGCDSIIQSIVDKYINISNIKFILCGSYVDTMKNLADESNPLFGRMTIKLNIKPLDYYESAKFYPDFSNEDKVRLYSVFGGVPFYLQYIDGSKSVKENILELIASPNARLINEVEQTISTEIKKIVNINETFTAIAAGNHTFSDILNNSHVSSSPTLADVLNKLIGMDIVARIIPINEKNGKHAIYEISDRMSLFYYTYIFRKSSFFNTMPSDLFYDEFISEDFETNFVPKAFELISKQFLLRMNLMKKIEPVLYDVGKYYYNDSKNHKNGEFDVVTLNRNGYDFYEVKFISHPIDDAVAAEEKKQLDEAPIEYNRMGFFSKSGFNLSTPEKYILYTLDDLYE